ncbi:MULTISPECIES: DUF4426 domain-containing protein [Pseudoalteromonas]|uniref:DUF4426 domain-containing protein n=1 Tax=Pseudoalteromonas amylolytica TaxID=1859457 RepID=A0A1S1MYB6_9GAMM|nr:MULTISPECIES: DUF4426 domain-containing protein [Pseudoalteromonas]MCF6435007.1 DUF4426 domain-containing protein [Pseudoalteromonas sp. MMG022]OHU90647.1 hypothetical protein BFC16_03315 [Pseudoalteromonas sp. JW3]OHU92732.1 hypothetical protein BET10_04575 [Pseudoalteromonas amylolytica]
MNKYLSLALLLFVCAFAQAGSEQGGQFKTLGPWQVHYIAFPSTFIQPNIAKAYGLERSNYKATVNISVLSNSAEKPAQKVRLTGEARNLLGNKQNLEFKEVVDGDSVYYLAQIDFSNEETYRFKVTISQGNTQQVLNFQQKFYVD